MSQRENNINGPVFIVGMNGSGTTMLGDCLGNHPDLYIFPRETRVLPHFISNISSFGDLSELSVRRKLSDALGSAFAFWHENKNKPVVLDDESLRQPSFEAVVHSMYMHFAESQGKSRWGEKTPMYLQHIDLLSKTFPNALFIHIYRDGRDVAQSVHRRWNLEPRRTIYRWKKILTKGRDQGSKLGPSRYMEISYESLTENPERHLRIICEFLGLPFDWSVLRSSMRQMDPKIKADTIVVNTEKWKGYFSEKQLYRLELIAGRLLSDLGYETLKTKGDVNPSAVRLLWWLFWDRFRATRYFWQQYRSDSITANFRKILALLRQSGANHY